MSGSARPEFRPLQRLADAVQIDMRDPQFERACRVTRQLRSDPAAPLFQSLTAINLRNPQLGSISPMTSESAIQGIGDSIT